MNKRITVAGSGVVLVCTIFGTPAQATQPIQVLTLDQLDNTASSSVAQRKIRHHPHAHHNLLADESKSVAKPASSHKGESGDPIAAFAGDAPVNGRTPPVRRGKAGALSSGVMAGFYRINSGDTIARIATAFGQQPKDLMNWNNLTVSAPIQPGQVIRVGPPSEVRPRELTR
ncbi:lytic transglycosylase [Burkholderia diffusa]|uniref:lytic transglycosylase n=1 Tax=Burkholderia diffusa TaxID=488732 RepID=UPI001E466A51|nr:LysM domain-containing protein [Burkholderia diffusa]